MRDSSPQKIFTVQTELNPMNGIRVEIHTTNEKDMVEGFKAIRMAINEILRMRKMDLV